MSLADSHGMSDAEAAVYGDQAELVADVASFHNVPPAVAVKLIPILTPADLEAARGDFARHTRR